MTAIYENNYYKVVTGIAQMPSDPVLVYQVHNKEHKVVEYESSCLPECIKAADHFKEALDESLATPTIVELNAEASVQH